MAAVAAIPGGVRRKQRSDVRTAIPGRSRRDSGGREAVSRITRQQRRSGRSRRDSGGGEAVLRIQIDEWNQMPQSPRFRGG